MEPRAEVPRAIRICVVLLALSSAAAAVALGDSPPSPRTTDAGLPASLHVVIAAVNWSTAWAYHYSIPRGATPGVVGSCVTSVHPTGTPPGLVNVSGSTFDCSFVSGAGLGPWHGFEVRISAVVADPPFLVLNVSPVLNYGGADAVVATIELPPSTGIYELTGTVYFVSGPV